MGIDMLSSVKEAPVFSRRFFVSFIGGTSNQRALICHAISDEALHVEPVASADELSLSDMLGADAVLVWNDDDMVADVAGRFTETGCWSPIIAISAKARARQVVRAIAAGAVDYLEWPCDNVSLSEAVHAVCEQREDLLSAKKRQVAARHALEKLSVREQQVLAALSQGRANKEIARELSISPRTVEVHRANLMAKLDAKNSADAIRIALEASLSDLPALGADNAAPPHPARVSPLSPAPEPAPARACG